MNKSLMIEIAVFVLLIVSGVALLGPIELGVLTHQTVVSTTLLLMIMGFISFAIFFWKEKAADERESLHQYMASRSALLFGTIIIIVGICVQAFYEKAIDIWLILTLIAFITGKIVTRLYCASQK